MGSDGTAGFRDLVADVRRHVDIAAVVGGCTDLKPNGHNGHFIGRCFAHDERTPSLHVYPDHYHCFGCGAHGDVFDAYRHLHGGSFLDAVLALAREVGVDVLPPSPDWIAAQEKRRATSRLLADITVQAEKWLWDPAKGAAALAYLRGRGLSDDTIRGAHLGFWPTGQSHAALEGDTKPYTLEQFREIGFLARSKEGREYDILYGCVAFPVIVDGQIASLTGRRIDADVPKGQAHRKLAGVPCPPLYGLQGIARACDHVVVCEGEIDALTLQQAGVDAIGLLGATANRAAAIRILEGRRGLDRVTLMLDADATGEAATVKMARDLGTLARICRPNYPETRPDSAPIKDPNGLLQCLGPDGAKAFFDNEIARAPTFLAWIMARLDGSDPETRARRVREDLVPYLAGINEIERAPMIDRLKVGWGIPRATLEREVKALLREDKESAKPVPPATDNADDLVVTALDEHYHGLFYESGGDAGTTLTLWATRRGEERSLKLSNARQAMATLAPELGDVTKWLLKLAPSIETRQVPAIITGALSRMTQRLDSKGGMTILSQGLHFVDKVPVLVDRNVAFTRKDGLWQPIESPIVADRYFVRPNPELLPWLPWSADELNRPPVYTPEEALTIVHEAIMKGWLFTDDCDALFHALLLFALPWNCLWPRKPLIHVRAGTTSGKSKLLNGLYRGGEKNMLGGLCPCSHYTTNFTAAGLLGLLGNTTLVLILDEFEHSDQRREALTEVLALLRASSTGGAGRLRGTKTLGARVDRLDVPVMAGAVEPIGANDADFNRWLVTGLAHVEGKEHPGTALRKWCALRKIDWDGLRRAVTLGLADRVEEMQQAYDEVSQIPDLAGDAVIDSRFLEGIHPVLAVARVLGRDPHVVARLLVDAKAGQVQNARVNRRGNRLLEALLAAPITIPDAMNRPQRTTLAWLLSPQPLTRFALPELGVTAEEDSQHPGHVLLWVYWPTAYRSDLLKGSEFVQDRVDNLASVAADGDCWVDNGQQKRVGALGNKKTTLFRIPRERIREALGL